MKEEQPLVFGLNNQILQEKGNYYNLILYIVMYLMEMIMKQIVALLIVTGFLAGCGAQVSLTASVPEGKDLDVTIKTSETPGN